MDWELVKQLGLQAPAVLYRGPKKWFFEKSYTVEIGEWSEWAENTHELTWEGLVWFTDGLKTERGMGAAVWREGSGFEVVCRPMIPMPPFSKRWSRPSRSVFRLCLRETAGASLIVKSL